MSNYWENNRFADLKAFVESYKLYIKDCEVHRRVPISKIPGVFKFFIKDKTLRFSEDGYNNSYEYIKLDEEDLKYLYDKYVVVYEKQNLQNNLNRKKELEERIASNKREVDAINKLIKDKT